MSARRGAAALTFRRCLRVAALPTGLATLAALGLQRLVPVELGHQDAPGAGTPWLNAPLFVAAVACAAAAVQFWPLFARERPGADWLRRGQRGAFGGTTAALAGALLAQLVLTVPLTTLLARALGAPVAARAQVATRPPDVPLLLRTQPELVLPLPHRCDAAELLLRPQAGPPAGAPTPTRVRIAAADDTEVAPIEVTFAATRQLARVPFAAPGLAAVRLTWLDGNVPLLFDADSVVCVERAPRSTLANGLAVALAGLVPTFVALALACLCGAIATLPTTLATAIAAVFVGTIGGLGPLGEGVTALLRGRWFPLDECATRSALPGAVGVAALALALLARRRAR